MIYKVICLLLLCIIKPLFSMEDPLKGGVEVIPGTFTPFELSSAGASSGVLAQTADAAQKRAAKKRRGKERIKSAGMKKKLLLNPVFREANLPHEQTETFSFMEDEMPEEIVQNSSVLQAQKGIVENGNEFFFCKCPVSKDRVAMLFPFFQKFYSLENEREKLPRSSKEPLPVLYPELVAHLQKNKCHIFSILQFADYIGLHKEVIDKILEYITTIDLSEHENDFLEQLNLSQLSPDLQDQLFYKLVGMRGEKIKKEFASREVISSKSLREFAKESNNRKFALANSTGKHLALFNCSFLNGRKSLSQDKVISEMHFNHMCEVGAVNNKGTIALFTYENSLYIASRKAIDKDFDLIDFSVIIPDDKKVQDVIFLGDTDNCVVLFNNEKHDNKNEDKQNDQNCELMVLTSEDISKGSTTSRVESLRLNIDRNSLLVSLKNNRFGVVSNKTCQIHLLEMKKNSCKLRGSLPLGEYTDRVILFENSGSHLELNCGDSYFDITREFIRGAGTFSIQDEFLLRQLFKKLNKKQFDWQNQSDRALFGNFSEKLRKRLIAEMFKDEVNNLVIEEEQSKFRDSTLSSLHYAANITAQQASTLLKNCSKQFDRKKKNKFAVLTAVTANSPEKTFKKENGMVFEKSACFNNVKQDMIANRIL